MNTKKSFQEVVAFLQQNSDKKVGDIIEDVLLMTISKKIAETSRTNEKGQLEVYCWYHKEWENTTLIEYGKKASTETGLNTFCKVGVNQWTKQQSDSKKEKAQLLEDDVRQHASWIETVALKHSVSSVAAISPSLTRLEKQLRESTCRAATNFKHNHTTPLKTGKPVNVRITFKSILIR